MNENFFWRLGGAFSKVGLRWRCQRRITYKYCRRHLLRRVSLKRKKRSESLLHQGYTGVLYFVGQRVVWLAEVLTRDGVRGSAGNGAGTFLVERCLLWYLAYRDAVWGAHCSLRGNISLVIAWTENDLESKVRKVARRIVDWIEERGLQIAPESSQVVVMCRRRRLWCMGV